MFIYSNWEKICEKLSKDFNIICANEISNQEDQENWLVVKHDIETDVGKAFELAKIENKYNIRATYYVQADLVENNYKTLQQIAAFGHEVTYHYDVLDACDGDYEKAIESFTENIEMYHSFGFDITTVCPHGNPIKIRNGWSSNKDFFKDKNVNTLFPNILDIVVHLPDKLKREYVYISDAGYSFKKIVNVHKNDKKNYGDIDLGSDTEFLNTLNTEENIILSTHPHRWEKNKVKFIFKIYFFKIIRFVARQISKIPFFKKIMSKYYYLAKKV